MALSAASGNLCRTSAPQAGRSRPLQLLMRFEAWIDRRRSRRALYQLNEHALKDLGLTAADLERADPPSSWQALLLPAGRR